MVRHVIYCFLLDVNYYTALGRALLFDFVCAPLGLEAGVRHFVRAVLRPGKQVAAAVAGDVGFAGFGILAGVVGLIRVPRRNCAGAGHKSALGTGGLFQRVHVVV